VAAGGGSESADQRLRRAQYEQVTVAEPQNLQRCQIVNDMNRAISGAEWSVHTWPLHVVMAANISFDGGDGNIFDPGNGYRDACKAIWGRN